MGGGVGKRRRGGSGFAVSRPSGAPRQPSISSSGDCSAEEKQAADLIRQQRHQEAEVLYRNLIASGRVSHTIYASLAAICALQGRGAERIALLHLALQCNPDAPDLHDNLGTALQAKGDLQAAIACFQTALRLRPDFASAHNNLGTAWQLQGDLNAAIACYRTAIQFNPRSAEAHYNLGNALQRQGELTAAIASYTTALTIHPHAPDTHTLLAMAWQAQGELDAAIASFEACVRLRPADPEGYYNLGNALQDRGDFSAAIEAYGQALRLRPADPEALNNLANALKQQGDLQSAITAYGSALQLRPDFPEAHWNLSLTQLLAGDYRQGWQRYGWRMRQPQDPSRPHAEPGCSPWQGGSPQSGDRLLLISEQGFGDTLQFMRYVLPLRELGCCVSLCAQHQLHGLIRSSGIDANPLRFEEARQVRDGYWIPLLSLPGLLDVSPEQPIITEPYIRTTDPLISRWMQRLSTEKRPIIGIHWQGNPGIEKGWLKGRSLPLDAFAPIAALADVSLLSLQKGAGREQRQTCRFRDRFVSCQDQIDGAIDFLETAAVIANCDLIITSDTAVAHLAGGMGKPTWLLLQRVPEWRWGLEGDTTFWYPSMRLFRQRERGDWEALMIRVAAALERLVSAKPMGGWDPSRV